MIGLLFYVMAVATFADGIRVIGPAIVRRSVAFKHLAALVRCR